MSFSIALRRYAIVAALLLFAVSCGDDSRWGEEDPAPPVEAGALDGDMLEWDAAQSAWVATSFVAGSGTVQEVHAGAGLVTDQPANAPIQGTGTIDLNLSATGGLAKDLGASTNELGIATDGVTSAHLADGTIAAIDLAADSVAGGAGGAIEDNTITSDDLALGAVSGGPGGAVADGTITTDDLADTYVNEDGSVPMSGALSIDTGAANDMVLDETGIAFGSGGTQVFDFTNVAGSVDLRVDGSSVLTTADAGSGNGLEADTVDGFDSGEFAILAGQGGGQQLHGGNAAGLDLTLRGNTAGDGDVIVADDSGTVGIGAVGAAKFHVAGDAEVTTDLVVDTDTLFVDSTNDRVGVNVLAPTEALDVSGNIVTDASISAGNDIVATNQLHTGTTTGAASGAVVVHDGNVGTTYATTILGAASLGADRTLDLPDASGTVELVGHTHTLANVTDAGTIAGQDADAVDIDGGAIDDTAIGATTQASGSFTTLTSTLVLDADGDVQLGDTAGDAVTVNGILQGTTPLVFEGAVSDAHTTMLQVFEPSQTNTITLPNATGTVVLDSDLGTIAGQDANAVAITGGAISGTTIDNAVIGGTTQAAGSFTDLTVSGNTILGDEPTDTLAVAPATIVLDGATTGGTTITLAVPEAVSTSKVINVPDGDGTLVLDADLGTIASQDASNVAVSGGAIDDTTIGATTPSTAAFSTLQVTGGAGTAGHVLTADATGNATWQAAPGAGSLSSGGGTANSIAMFTSPSNIEDSVITDDGSGNIGVGAVSPGAKLHVAGEMQLLPVSDASVTTTGTIYFDTEDDQLYYRDSVGWQPIANAAAGGAPTNMQYVTIAADGALSDERVLAVSANLSLTDSGANSPITIGTDAFSGDVTTLADSFATTIGANVVTDSKLRQGVANSVIGRAANSAGNVADIASGGDDRVLVQRTGTLQFDTLANTDISGLGTMSTQNATAVAITGGTIETTAIDDSAIGGTTPSTGAFTTITATDLSATGNVTLGDNLLDTVTVTGVLGTSVPLRFEGAAVDANEVALQIAALTGDQTITLPDATGTVVLDGDIGTIASQDADSVNIDGGAIDSTPIGGATPSTGAFTTLSASGNITSSGTLTLGNGTGPVPGEITLHDNDGDDSYTVTLEAPADVAGANKVLTLPDTSGTVAVLSDITGATQPDISGPGAPGQGHDSFDIGGLWLDTNRTELWICLDNTAATAVWKKITGLVHRTAGAPGASHDRVAGFPAGSIWIDTTGPDIYMSTSDATATAVWVQTFPTVAAAAGSPSEIQFNTANALDASDELTFDTATDTLTVGATAGGSLAVQQGSVNTAETALEVTSTWFNGGVAFTGVHIDVTDSASDPASRLLDVEANAVSVFSVAKGGAYVNGDLVVDTDTLNVDSVGDLVGVGTDAPQAKLHARVADGNVATEVVRLEHGNSAGIGTAGRRAGLGFSLETDAEGSYGNVAEISGVMTTATDGAQSGDLAFTTYSGGTASEVMRVDSSGYLGIGTTSPVNMLHIAGDHGVVVAESAASYSSPNADHVLLGYVGTTGRIYAQNSSNPRPLTVRGNTISLNTDLQTASTASAPARLEVAEDGAITAFGVDDIHSVVTLQRGTDTGGNITSMRLDVDGPITLNPTLAATMTDLGGVAGRMYYEDGTNVLKLHDGTDWRDVLTSAATGLNADTLDLLDSTDFVLINGRPGGQIICGGDGSDDDLHLRGTSNVVKGNVYIGDESTAQVVIGDTTPQASSLLSMPAGGGTEIYFQPAGGTAMIAADSSEMLLGTMDTSPTKLFTNNSTRLTIEGDGDIGISDMTPNARLHVRGGTDAVEPTALLESYFMTTVAAATSEVVSALEVNASSAYDMGNAGGSDEDVMLAGDFTTTFTGVDSWALGGLRTQVVNNGTGTVENAVGLVIENYLDVGGVITNNTYGILINDLTPDNGTQNSVYSIYASDAEAETFFAGDVGIGTPTPTAKLDVKNGGLVVNAGGTNAQPISLTAGSPSGADGGPVSLAAGAGAATFQGGDVSIDAGDTSGTSDIDTSADVVIRGGTVDTNLVNASIEVGGGRSTTDGAEINGGVLTLRGGDPFSGGARSGGNILLLPGAGLGGAGDGLVGIGTSNPNSSLHVKSQYNGLLTVEETFGTSSLSGNHVTLGYYGGTGALRSVNNLNPRPLEVRSENVVFLTDLNSNAISSAPERMRITDTGDVGIGTATPGTRLHVQGGGMVVDAGNTNSDGISLTAGSPPAAATGGDVTVTGGSGNTLRGGNVTIQAGQTDGAAANATYSATYVRGGAIGAESNYAEIEVGGGEASTLGDGNFRGGDLILSAGDGVGTNQPGGHILLHPGARTGTSAYGHVGIGIDNPVNKLHLSSPDSGILTIESTSTFGWASPNNVSLGYYSQGFLQAASGFSPRPLELRGGPVSIKTDPSNLSTAPERLVVEGDGDVAVDTDTLFVDATNDCVGIGTPTPGAKVHAALEDAVTTMVSPMMQFDHTSDSTGTDVGFGTSIGFSLEEATDALEPAAELAVEWENADDTFERAALTVNLRRAGDGIRETARHHPYGLLLTHDAPDAMSPKLEFRSRGIGVSEEIDNNFHMLGWIGAQGWDSAAYATGAYMTMYADQAWGPTAHGTRIEFYTTPNDSAGSIERLSIGNDGNVFIGNGTATTKLQVDGTITTTGITMPTGAVDGRVLTTNGSGVATWKAAAGGVGGSGTSGNIAKFTGTGDTLTDSMLYEDTGFPGVTIGTSTAAAKLHVEDAATVTSLVKSTGNSAYVAVDKMNDADTAGVLFRRDSTPEWTVGTRGGGNFSIYNASTTATPILVDIVTDDISMSSGAIYVDKSENNVGIRMAPSAGYALDVNGILNTTGFRMPTGASDGHVLTSDASGNATWTAPTGDVTGSGTAERVARWSSASGLGNSSMYDAGDGRVGIGAAPAAGVELDVVGDVDIDNTLTVRATGTGMIVYGDIQMLDTTPPGTGYAASAGYVQQKAARVGKKDLATYTLSSATMTNIQTVDITTNDAGVVIVQATGSISFVHDGASYSTYLIGVGGDASSLSNTCSISWPDVATAGTYQMSFASTFCFNVGAGSTYTYYLNGRRMSGPNASLTDIHMNAIFVSSETVQ